jgi:hypothetical protein
MFSRFLFAFFCDIFATSVFFVCHNDISTFILGIDPSKYSRALVAGALDAAE